MSLHVTVAGRVEDLLPTLFEHLGRAPADPFIPQIVVVPNAGMADWVRHRVALEYGIAANVDLLFPGRFRGLILGEEDTGADWEPRRLVWHVLDELTSDPAAAPGFARTDRPVVAARRIAELFDRYAIYRPEMVRCWADGLDVHRATDDGWEPVPEPYRWQPELWRRLRARVGEPSRAEETDRIRRHIADRTAEIPGAIALFGASGLGGAHAGVVTELAAHARVDAMLLTPSPAASARATHHPLVATWAVPAVETATVLQSLAVDVTVAPRVEPHPATLLGRLQRAIAEDASRARAARAAAARDELLTHGDGTVQLHGCHGAVRQVEALRDAILHLMVADPTLHARDVLIVAPDLARFASLVEPILGAEVGGHSAPDGSTTGGRRLAVDIRDRSLTATSEVEDTVRAVLNLTSGRATATAMLELLGLEPVRTAYALSEEDVELIARWTERLGIRWGLDGTDRVAAGYPEPLTLGTWREAVDRLVVGALVQAPSPRLVRGVAPFDDVADHDLHAIGMLGCLIDDLTALRDTTRDGATLAEWTERCWWIADRFLGSDGSSPGSVQRFRDEVRHLEEAAPLSPDATISAAEIADFISGGLEERAARAAPLRDALTVCSTIPRRGVPARVVAILGFDERAVQRATGDGDDVLALHRERGEPDRALDQRQALLEVVLAAREHLIVTYDAHSPRDNRRVPPPIALDELADAIADEVDRNDHRAVVVEHTRQLAHPTNLGGQVDPALAGRSVRDLVVEGPWTFEESALVGLRSERTPPAPPGSTLPGPVPPLTAATIGDLADALLRPAELYLRDRLGVTLRRRGGTRSDAVDLWPDALTEATLGRELLAVHERGASAAEQWRRMRPHLGGLPPGDIGEAALDVTVAQVATLREWIPEVTGPTRTLEIALAIDHGAGALTLRDRVEVTGDTVLRVAFTKWDETRRVRPMIELAAAMLTEPDRDWRAVVVTRPAGKNVKPVVETLRLANPDALLRFAIDLHTAARNGPVPHLPRSSWLHRAKPSPRAAALRYDLFDPYTATLLGELDLADLDLLEGFHAWADRLEAATTRGET